MARHGSMFPCGGGGLAGHIGRLPTSVTARDFEEEDNIAMQASLCRIEAQHTQKRAQRTKRKAQNPKRKAQHTKKCVLRLHGRLSNDCKAIALGACY